MDSRTIVLREATAADVRRLAELHVRTFNETHGPGPIIALRQQQWESAFSAFDGSWFCVVLENEAGDLIGFARGQPYNHAELGEFKGELNKIYLLRAYHRRGLGRLLLCASARRFLERGIRSMLLFGDARNPSNGFYEAMRGEKLFALNGEFHGAYGWRDLDLLVRGCDRAS
jgi:L-amino acid N-acyltransferase YncA